MDLFDTFIQFSELPTELRLTIWQMSLPKERNVEIFLGRNRRTGGPKGYYSFTVRSLSRSNPITLFVNHESRMETLRYYKLIFRPDFLFRGDAIYFDPAMDYVFVDLYRMTRESVMEYLEIHGDSVVEDMNAIPITHFSITSELPWWERGNKWTANLVPYLSELNIVLKPPPRQIVPTQPSQRSQTPQRSQTHQRSQNYQRSQWRQEIQCNVQ